MATPLISDELWELIQPLLPPETPRPRVLDRAALESILYVLKTGIGWEHLPRELGYGSGMTCWRRARGGCFHPPAPGAPRPHGAGGSPLLVTGVWTARASPQLGGGPEDRGRPGSKRHVIVDALGTPLAMLISPANRYDSMLFEPLLDAVPPGLPRARHQGTDRPPGLGIE